MEGKTNLNQFQAPETVWMAWPHWPWPLYFTTELRHWWQHLGKDSGGWGVFSL